MIDKTVGSSAPMEERLQREFLVDEFWRLDSLLSELNSCDDLGLLNLEKLRQEVVRRIEAIRKSL